MLWTSPRRQKSVFSLGEGLSSLEAWFSTALDIEEVLSWVGSDEVHVMFADVKSFDRVDRSVLPVHADNQREACIVARRNSGTAVGPHPKDAGILPELHGL